MADTFVYDQNVRGFSAFGPVPFGCNPGKNFRNIFCWISVKSWS
jgi:hypothetical protein